MTDFNTIRSSAVANGLAVSPRGIRLVTYHQDSNGTWRGTWYAAERSMRAARLRLAEVRAAGTTAELLKDGVPC